MAYDLSVIDRYTLQFRRVGTSIFIDIVDTADNSTKDTTEFNNAGVSGPIPKEVTLFAQNRLNTFITGASLSGSGSIGLVASTKMPTWSANQSAVKWFNQRLRCLLYDDIQSIQFGYTLQYGANENASSGTASITQSIDKRDGTRVQVTFGGSATGIIPATGLLLSDDIPLGETRNAGEFLTYRSKVTFNGTGTNGYHRDLNYWNPLKGTANAVEIANSVNSGGAEPADLTMSGSVTQSGTPAGCFRPVLILGKTNKETFVVLGDSLNAADFANSYITDAYGQAGTCNRRLTRDFATLNLAQFGDSYANISLANRFDLRTILGRYANNVLDCYGINDPNLSLANFITYATTMKARFPNKPYGHSTYLPRTVTVATTGDTAAATSVAGQTIHSSATTHCPILNPAIRAGVAPLDFYVDPCAAVENLRGTGIWKPNPVSIGTVKFTDNGDFSTSRWTAVIATVVLPGTFNASCIGRTIAAWNNSNAFTQGTVLSVAADGSYVDVQVVTSTSTTERPCYLNALVMDSNPVSTGMLHTTIDGDLAIENHEPAWLALKRFKK